MNNMYQSVLFEEGSYVDKNVKYWCCPRCGIGFVQTSTYESNTYHMCHGGMVMVPNPYKRMEQKEILFTTA